MLYSRTMRGVIVAAVVVALVAAALVYTRELHTQKTSMNNDAVFMLTSSAFLHGGIIPAKYTCDGDNLSPPLAISGVPEGTKSLALIMDDPDIPREVKTARGIDVFDHWALYDLPADTMEIPEGAAVGRAGINGRGDEGYTGPCPPREYEPREHRYFFTLYALSDVPSFDAPPTKEELKAAMTSATLAKTELMGRYARP